MVRRLFRGLEKVDLVFHPNVDGTACPHGMKRPLDLFRGGNTRSATWLSHFLERIKGEGISYKIFAPIFDIDRFEDLLMFYYWQLLLEDNRNEEFYCSATMKYLKSLALPQK